jgi:hypothetical protein
MMLLYSPQLDELILELHYPNEVWRRDRTGQYKVRVSIATLPVRFTRYYFVGNL